MPAPMCRSIDEQSTSNSQATPLKWQSRLGAIATDAPHGIISPVKDQLNRSDTERAAIADCKAKGGVDCELQIT